MRFSGYTLVWGDKFVTRFIDLCAPTWMAEGNLPYFVANFDYEHVILTLKSDWEKIESSDTYAYMSGFFPIRKLFLDDVRIGFRDVKEKYEILGRVQGVVFRDFYESGSEGFFDIYPDTVWSDGICIPIVREILNGKRIYFTKPIRVWEDGTLNHISNGSHTNSLDPRHLVKISIGNLHPDWSYYEIDCDHHGDDEKCIWMVEDKGFLVKSYQPSPFVFVPNSREHLSRAVEADGMIDSVLHVIACPDKETYYFQEDSDEGVVIEPIKWENIPKVIKSGTKADNYAMFLRAALANPRSHNHISRLEKTYRFHFEDLDESWGPVEQEADRFIEKVIGDL